jgi:hypothetical protein
MVQLNTDNKTQQDTSTNTTSKNRHFPWMSACVDYKQKFERETRTIEYQPHSVSCREEHPIELTSGSVGGQQVLFVAFGLPSDE